MKMIGEEKCWEPYDVKLAAMKKISKKPKLKDKEHRTYTFDRFYRHHVAMIGEFGQKRCFRYSEILWSMA